MKRLVVLLLLMLMGQAGEVFSQDSGSRLLGEKMITGKLEWSDIGDLPYVVSSKNQGAAIQIELDEDKKDRKFKNKKIHQLVGKMVRVSGPMYVITADTEYKGIEFIDLTKNKGNITEIR